MPIVRTVVGALLLLLAVPLLLAGGGLWIATDHRDTDGAYTAQIDRIHADGYAVVVPDIDALLRSDIPFARGGKTTMRVWAAGSGGPLLVGLAPRAEVEGYLAGVPHTRLTGVRLARGPLPVQTVRVPGTIAPPDRTTGIARGFGPVRDDRVGNPLAWSSFSVRDADLALVVMRADGAAGFDVALRGSLTPAWLPPTTWGLLTLGTCLLLLGAVALAWPRPRRDIVYVVEVDRVQEIAARLGVEAPSDRSVWAAVPAQSPRPAPALPAAEAVDGGSPEAVEASDVPAGQAGPSALRVAPAGGAGATRHLK